MERIFKWNRAVFALQAAVFLATLLCMGTVWLAAFAASAISGALGIGEWFAALLFNRRDTLPTFVCMAATAMLGAFGLVALQHEFAYADLVIQMRVAISIGICALLAISFASCGWSAGAADKGEPVTLRFIATLPCGVGLVAFALVNMSRRVLATL